MIKYSFILTLFFCTACLAQDLPPITQQQLENTADANEDENQEDDNLLQQLDYYKKHPVNINSATLEELQILRFLTDLQINNLIRYRSIFGNLISIYELQAVPSWDLITIRKILPYITVTNSVTLKESFLSRFKGDQSFLFRITRVMEKSKGYDTSLNTHYLGDRNHLMVRYRYQFKDLLYIGLTGDKDAGEQFFKGAQSRGFDFYSFHFFVRRLGIIKSLAVGDYAVNLGQGLIQWQSLAFGKSSEVMSIKRQSPVLVPYRAAGEFYFNRGIAVTLQKKKVEATAFASYKKISGNIVNDTAERFTSLLTSGYYRTSSEVSDRNKISLTSFGGNLSYQTSSLKLGLNTIIHHFDIPLQKRDEPYNFYSISGKKIFNSSIDYSYTYKNLHLFGEAATDKNLHFATVSAALLSVDPKVDLSFLYRNIQKEYQSLFGNAFTENTSPVNEKGAYCGVAVRPIAGWQFSVFADFFQFPWLRYRVAAPSSGHDYLVQINYQPNKQFETYLRYRNKNKPIDAATGNAIHYPVDEIKQNLRLHFSQQLSSKISLQSRVELLWFQNQKENQEQGFLGYIEAAYNQNKISSNVRVQYFETNSYNSRIYAYESDVLYSFSIPAFYDKGLRYYFNIHINATKKLQCWVRLAQTVYIDNTNIGSGLDEINGKRKTEIKLQFLYVFKR